MNSSTRGRQPLSERISDSLIEMMATGELKPGDSLPSESELADRFGVSKPTVRESLRQLALFGAVEIKQGKVARVKPLDSSALEGFFRLAIRSHDNGLREALELRRAIEVEIAALAAERATPQAVRELEDAWRIMEANVDNFDQWLVGDYGFHIALARASRNGIMLHAIEGLGGVIRYLMRVLGMQSDLRNARGTLARHKAILDAVRDHDVDAARAAMGAHFDAARPFLAAIAGDRSRLARI